MKISINYNLMEEIAQANKGFSLSREAKECVLKSSIVTTLMTLIEIGDPNALLKGLKWFPICFFTYIGINLLTLQIFNKATKGYYFEWTKDKALNNLRELSVKLKSINVDTDSNLLLETKEYKSKYKIRLNESKIPYILQEKYILVPSYDYDEIKDTSLLQEHIIGSKKYVLSKGSPQKKLKLAYSNI